MEYEQQQFLGGQMTLCGNYEDVLSMGWVSLLQEQSMKSHSRLA